MFKFVGSIMILGECCEYGSDSTMDEDVPTDLILSFDRVEGWLRKVYLFCQIRAWVNTLVLLLGVLIDHATLT